MMSNEEKYYAVVEKIIHGRHGPFAVARCEELTGGSVTFSLTTDVWKESDWPESGMFVVLTEVRKKRAGWRAKHGRYLKPSDEPNQKARSREQ